MADYSTPRPTNPVGSTDLAVAKDNLISHDLMINSPDPTFTTRFGKEWRTLVGISQDVAAAIANSGGQPLNGGVWAAGQTFEAYNQFMIFNGIAYKPLPTTPLPYGPTGAAPDGNFVGPYADFSQEAATKGEKQHINESVFPADFTQSAIIGATCPAGTTSLRDAINNKIYLTSSLVSGLITALDFNDGTATVGGVSITLTERVDVSSSNISTYTDLVYKASASDSAIDAMIAEFNLNPLANAIGTATKTGATNWSYEDSTGPVTLDNFRAFNVVHVDDFAKRGETDYYTAIQAAIDYVAALPSAEHDGSYTFGYNVGASRGVIFNPVRYPVSQSIVMKNNVSLVGNKAAISAAAGFTVGDPILTTDGTQISAAVTNLTLDGNAQNIKGVLLSEIFNCVWTDITILNCGDDSFTVETGAQFTLNGFSFSCSDTPVRNNVAGLKVSTADMMFSNGICQFHPVGVYIEGNGNNEYVNIHCWGAYTRSPQYINFYLKNTYRNTFTNCYGDSPTKQDFGLDNTTPVGGFPNGGVCFYLEREGTVAAGSQGNVFINSRCFCNKTNWDIAGLSGQHLLYGYIDAFCFFNQFINTVRVEGDSRVPFLDDVWGYWNNDINRSTTVFDNEIRKTEDMSFGDGTCSVNSDESTPEGSVDARQGSMYLRKNAGLSSNLYLKEFDSGSTGWMGVDSGNIEGGSTFTIGSSTKIATLTPVGFGVTRVEVDVTAAETAAYFGAIVRKFVFLIRTVATTDITTPQLVADFSITNSNSNYAIEASLTAVDAGSGAVDISLTITESGALSPTQADVRWKVNAKSTKLGLTAV